MATITLYNGLNLNAQTFYDFLDQDLTSVSTTRISYDTPLGDAQFYSGFFEFDMEGNASVDSHITAIDHLNDGNLPLWSISDLNLPVSDFKTYIDSNAIVGINDSSKLMEYILRNDDQILGSSGADSAILFDGNDGFVGLEGNDIVNGHSGNDTLNGHSGSDTIRGGADDDTTRGGADNDTLMGDRGNDHIYGDRGDDTLYGGEGADQFIFKPDSGADVIGDFESADQLLIYIRSAVLEIDDIDIDVSNGNTILSLGFGENITLLNYDSFSVNDITLIT